MKRTLSGGGTNHSAKRYCTYGGKQFVAFFIALAVVLTPLQLPLSSLNTNDPIYENQSVEANIPPRDYYETHTSKKVLPVAFVYKKGEATPNVHGAEIVSEQPNPVLEVPSPLLATIDAPVAVTLAELKNKKIRSYSHNSNVIAATQVAEGTSASELTSVTLDENANIIATIDAHGETTRAEYNDAGQPIRIINADGTTSYYAYDENGNLTGITRTKNETVASTGFFSTLAHNFLKPLWAVADDTENTSFEYDGENPSVISDNQSQLSFEYDEEGLLTREYRDDGSTVDYAYDELGNVISKTETPADTTGDGTFSLRSLLSWSLASALPTTYSETARYNDDNRLAQFSISKDVPFSEIPATEATTTPLAPAVSTPETQTSPTTSAEMILPTPETITATTSTSTEVIIDSVPQTVPPATTTEEATTTPTTTEPQPESIVTEVISWLTNTSATLIARAYTAFSFTYADEAVVSSDVAQNISASTTPLLDLAFTYDAQGNVTETRTAQGLVTTYAYSESTNALSSKMIKNADGAFLTYNYVTDSHARVLSANGESYTYTDDGMLAGNGSTSYTYDDHGNRINTQASNGNSAYTYEGNRLSQVTYPNGRTITYTYNENGAVIESVDSEKGTTRFSYNTSGAIETIATANDTITYTYNALGERMTRTSSVTGTLTYSYTGSKLKKVSNDAGTILREYFYTPKNELIAVMMQDGLYHIVTDRSESIVALVQSDTGKVLTQEYDVWGNIVRSDFSSEFDLGYVGAYSEPTLGLSVLGPRVYSPAIGRFLSKDPLPGVIIDTLSQNEYIYAKNDPVNQYDPSGHESEPAEKSTSPKRALVETENTIAGVKAELSDAKELVLTLTRQNEETPDTADTATALYEATQNVESLTASLEILEGIRADQEQEIIDNEKDAEVAHVEATDVPAVASTTASSVPGAITEDTGTTTIMLDTASTSTSTSEIQLNISTPEILPQFDIPVSSSSEASTEEQGTVTTPELPSNTIVSFVGSILLASKEFISTHLSTAEAKTKAKAKSKAKAPVKAKAKVSAKAKKVQQEKAKKVATLTAKVNKLQKQLIGLLTVKVTTLKKEVAKAAVKKAQPGPALNKMVATTKTQKKALSTAPLAPSFNSTSKVTGISSAGISTPKVMPAQSLSSTLKSIFTSVTNVFTVDNSHIALTACGFEPTIIGATCGAIDGTLYLFQGRWGDAGLSVLSSVPFIGATADGAKAAKLALEIAEKARVGKVALILKQSSLIGNGHAFSEHISEFSSLGIATKEQFSSHIESVIKNADKTKELDLGRKAFLDEKTQTVVIFDPNSIDRGTAFIPKESWGGAINYFNQLH